MLYYALRASRKNAVEAYKFLRLDKDKSIRLLNARYNAWIRFLAKESDTSPDTISKIIKFTGRHGDEGLLKMLEALVMANARKDIQNELKSALMASWQSKKMPALDAFKLLKLDQQTNHKLYIKRLTMWAEYMKNAKLDMEAVIAGIDDITSLKIINDLKEIKGFKEVVESLQDSLVKSWANTKPEDVVTMLLHGSNSNFDMWLKYVARSTDTSSATVSAIIKFTGRHGDEGLLKMLEALLDQQTNHKLYIKRLTLWAEYMKNAKLDMKAVIAGIDDITSLKLIDDLKEIKGFKEVVESLQDSLVKSWANTKPEDVVTMLLHGSNSNFDMWLKYVARSTDTSSATVSAIIKFTGRYGDKGLLKMLEALLDQQADHELYIKRLTLWAEYMKNAKLDMKAVIAGIDDITSLKLIDDLKEIKGFKEVVESLQDSLVKSWANTKPEDVVTMLLHGSNSNFDMWLKYVARSTDTSSATVSAIIKFTGRYGDKGLLKMLEALVMANARKDLQNELNSALMASWKSRKKSAHDAFILLKLDQQADHELYIKRLTLWAEYMKDAKLDMKAVIAGIDDITSLKLIDDLKEIKGFKEVVESLQDSLVKSWANTKPEDVVTMLLHGSNSNFDMWLKYVARSTDTSSATVSAIIKFTGRYGDKGLLKMLEALVMANARKDLQNELNSALMASWKSRKKSAHDAFILLKLDQQADHELYIKRLTLWAEYMKDAKLDMKAVIAGFDDITSLKLIDDLKEIKGFKEVVESLQDSLVKSWANTKPEDVVTMLLHGSNSNFDMWLKYVARSTDTSSATVSAIIKFTGRHGDEGLLKMLEALVMANAREDIQNELNSALMASWKSRKKSAHDAFILLKLDQQADHELYIKRLTLWAEYMKDAKLDMKAVIAGFDDITSLKLIDDLKEIKGFKEVVESLQDSLVKSWANTKPEDVVAMLLHGSKPNFNTLAKYVVEASDPIQVAKLLLAKFSERPDDEGLVELFDAFAKAQVGEDIQNELKSALMASWQSKKMPALNAFKLLKLDQKTDHELYIKRLTLWAEYMKDAKLDMKAVIAGFDDNTSLKIIDDLKEIKSTEEVVESSQDTRVKSWADSKPEDVVTMLQPDSKPNFDTLAKYVEEASDPIQVAKPLIAKFSEITDDAGLVEMFNAFAKARVGEDIQNELKSALMASWQRKKISALEVFKLLKLEQKTDHKLYDNLLTMWVQYVKKSTGDYSDINMGVAINGSNLDVRVMILGHLRHITGTAVVVKNLEKTLVAQLQKRKGAFKEVVCQVFRDLKLDKDLNNLLHEPNLMLFNSFAEKFKPTPTKEVLITAARNVFLDKEVLIGEMLEFEWRKKDIATASEWRKKDIATASEWRKKDIATASELRLELFRQWYQTKRGLEPKDSMSKDLKSDYEGVIADPAIFNRLKNK
ncbi:unnamed protein product [Peronospora farinosa]|uniref:Uncharacterized protein n=1 Tax=Peronospora farinosa TaxID=134698 RepID=A0ABN8C057_9STRA|nr:unnamed protein product [Peronospora farinosa]